MVARGRIERAAHGVYRVPQVPETEYDQYRPPSCGRGPRRRA
ncbi:hypothetical protein [Pseudactinotalea sp. HY158]